MNDLSVIITNDLQCAAQCSAASHRKANTVLEFIVRNSNYKTRGVIRRLYTSLERPHLEYYVVQFWSPCHQRDINKSESVQRRATKLITGIRGVSYEERFKK